MHCRSLAAGRGLCILRCRRAFTLIELLVSVAIIAVLIGLVLPAVSAAMKNARGFRCQMGLRSVAFDFSLFADDQLHGDRGTDTSAFGSHRFSLETFQESQYRIDEFWGWGNTLAYTVPDRSGRDPMRCSEVRGELTLVKNKACSSGALIPPKNVSFAFNARLWRPEVQGSAVFTTLTSAILDHPEVPLVWDADAGSAVAKGVSPVFSTPSLGSKGAYADDEFWFPGQRHGGAMNVAFIGGHVESTSSPITQAWPWGFQPVK